MTFKSQEAAIERAKRTVVDARARRRTHMDLYKDIATQRYYLVKSRDRFERSGEVSHHEEVLCVDGRWRERRRVRRPKGQPA